MMARISDDEFERRMRALVEGTPAMPDAAADEAYRRAELDLLVDHRLGREFPAARRAALWDAHQQLERRRVWRILGALIGLVRQRDRSLARAIVAQAEKAYSAVLDPDELRRFMGEKGGGLPLDRDPGG